MSEQQQSSKVEPKAMKEHFSELVKRALLHVGGLRELEERLKDIVSRTSLREPPDESPPAT